MQRLTQTEEDVMQWIWTLDRVFVKDILAAMPEPKPPYNTISSVVRVLEKKGFVGHEAFGKTHRYYPIIAKSAYRRQAFRRLFRDYFDGSHQALLQFFAREEGLDPEEVERLMALLPDEDATYTPTQDTPASKPSEPGGHHPENPFRNLKNNRP
ncbi:MAG: BlaI/MecI/CopY family transcriptional regulator [Bacteroidetes bacterium]|nr:BlaI/MecI/CopY family transcriptional regulator [Bacteroidota bacterium]